MPIDHAPRIANGINAKLDFDFSCNRVNSFGEAHVHGVVNEILSANIDPVKSSIYQGYPHPIIQIPGRRGRKKEIDFAVQDRITESNEIYAEIKWAGSSHCNPDRILLDLCRLQIIKNKEPNSVCLFIMAGERTKLDDLFIQKFLVPGTQNLLHRAGRSGINQRTNIRIKSFDLNCHPQYAEDIENFLTEFGDDLPIFPTKIRTSLINSSLSAPHRGRFNTLIWRMELDA